MRSLNRALVVGGAGFFGSWLVEALLEAGVRTTVVDERAEAAAALPEPVELVEGDVSDLDLHGLFRKSAFDAVFQLAGSGTVPQTLLRPAEDLRRNTTTTLAVLEAARHGESPPLVLFVSSAAVYGEGRHMPMTEDHPLAPVSPYGISKLAAERYVSFYSTQYGIPTLSVRPFSLYGPRQRKLVVYDLLCRAFDGEVPLTVLGSPDVSRDFVFVEDAARMLVTLARAAPAVGEAYNLASGRPTTLGELVETLLGAAGLPDAAVFTGNVRPGDPLHWEGDPAKATALGAVCTTELRDGLRSTADWFIRSKEAESVV
jgi:UDP-glucose 4-epimerase